MNKAIRLHHGRSDVTARVSEFSGPRAPPKCARFHSWEDATLTPDDFVAAYESTPDTAWKPAFAIADKSQNGALDKREFIDAVNLLLQANGLARAAFSVDAEFERADEDSNRALDSEEFEVFYHRFTRSVEARRLLQQMGIAVEAAGITIDASTLEPDRLQAVLNAVLRLCPEVTQVRLTGAGKLDESTLSTFLQQTKGRLTLLDLSHSRLDDKAAKAIAAYCPNLRSLSVAGCELTDAGLAPIAKFCKHLRHLDVTNCSEVNLANAKLATECGVIQRVSRASTSLPSEEGAAEAAGAA